MERRGWLAPILVLVLQTGVAGVPNQEFDALPDGKAPTPWEHVLDWLRSERDRMSGDLEKAHAKLLVRARAVEDEDLVERLSLEPPGPRPGGYGVLPEIRDERAVEPIEPTRRTYSLERLTGDFSGDFRDAAVLAGRVTAEADLPLESSVSEFERLRTRMRNLEDHLDYHARWQVAVTEHAEFFRRQNRIVDLVRRMERSRRDGGPEESVNKLRAEVLDRIASFDPAPDLAMEHREHGMRVLPVTVWTDIGDVEFLEAFRAVVETAFSRCEAARSKRFALELRMRRISPDKLYPEGAPAHGTPIDPVEHRARFPERKLILTTGAQSTHAWQGRIVLLGSTPLSRNTLVHEFAHLLGFGDEYLRGFEGEVGDPFGVMLVEWTGLGDDLMGWPAGGAVSERMIARLIEAYGGD